VKVYRIGECFIAGHGCQKLTPKARMMQSRCLNMIVHIFDRSPIFDIVVVFELKTIRMMKRWVQRYLILLMAARMRFGD
jgi:hypothetical protein